MRMCRFVFLKKDLFALLMKSGMIFTLHHSFTLTHDNMHSKITVFAGKLERILVEMFIYNIFINK